MRTLACGCVDLACAAAGELVHVARNEITAAPCSPQSGFYWSNRLAQVIWFLETFWFHRVRSAHEHRVGGLRAGWGKGPAPERLEKRRHFCIKASGVRFCAPSNGCLCSEGDWSGHALMLSFKWISDNRLRKSRRDLWLLTGAAVSPEPGRVQPPPPLPPHTCNQE